MPIARRISAPETVKDIKPLKPPRVIQGRTKPYKRTWKLKSRWYRPPSLARHTTDYEIEHMDKAYIGWLCRKRRWREKQAQAYVQAQRDQLQQRVEQAVEQIETKLQGHGFRRVIQRYQANSLLEYDMWLVEYERKKQAAKDAWERARASKVRFDAQYAGWSDERRCQYHNSDERPVYRELERRASELDQETYAHGHISYHGFWYRPGQKKVIWVGTRNPLRYYGCPDVDYKIVIRPGRAPQDEELNQIVAEAVEFYDEASLPLAAE